MSRGSRFRTLFILLGTILATAPAGAEDKPGAPSAESKADGQWTDPPAKVQTPATNAVAKPVATPAKIDESKIPARVEARAPRRSAKVRRERIRTVASRERPARQERAEGVRAERPSRRIVARRPVPREARAVAVRGLRPVYGYIPPDAPADAYYAQRRFGTVGRRPGDLGLPPEDGPAFRNVGMREDGHLVMRWRRPGVPAAVFGPSSPFDDFGGE
jgi:hypothetical protein